MDPRERVKKPEPGRTQPIRNWGVVFERPGQPPSENAVSHGVETGYRVIEEYLRQGQNAARTMSTPPASGGAPPDDGFQGRMGAMLRTFADFTSLWMDLMGRATSGGTAAREPGVTPAVGTAGPFSAGSAPGAAESSPEAHEGASSWLTLDIESTRRTEVTVDLRPRSSDRALRVPELRSPEPGLPHIQGVIIEAVPGEERMVIRIRVPDAQPPGSYSGIILDEQAGLPRGTLSVRVVPR
jgi:hypothetical protein